MDRYDRAPVDLSIASRPVAVRRNPVLCENSADGQSLRKDRANADGVSYRGDNKRDNTGSGDGWKFRVKDRR
jgi:hypothetical protein